MAAREKGPVFRVTGLPAAQPGHTLDETLNAAIVENLSEEEKSRLVISATIVPSCYGNDQSVALVEFRGGVPLFLSGLERDWQVEMGETDINFDSHFFGFTQLYTPRPDAPITVDIIAITGLDGHAYGSWRGKGNLRRMWLRDFLSKDLPCCRTMIYGYSSKLSSHGIGTIMDYSRELMEELKKVRYTTEQRQRPLLFIAHSFGGIILAHCLVQAVQADDDDDLTIASLHRATYGMLLFAIPHRGLVVDDIQKMLAGQDNHPRNDLLQHIKVKSDLLASQLVYFKNLIRDRKVVSFYETEQTRQLQFDSGSRSWKRTGDFVTAVDTESALLELPDHMEEKIPLHTDHSLIVKFNTRNDQGCSSALRRLKQFERDAPGVVAARFSRIPSVLNPCTIIPFRRDTTFVGREDILAEIRERHEQAGSQHHSRVAFVGLGGVGKSQVAIEYAYRVRESTQDMWVFWVHASNAARFEQGYRDIAAKVEAPGRDEPKVDILQLVYNWLCDERNGRWLLILDNVDDGDVFFTIEDCADTTQKIELTSPTRPLESFLPQTSNGAILITSRNRIAATNLVGTHGGIIQVEPMEEEDALTLLNTKVSVDGSSKADAKTLVHALEGIPLAISHAAAYIKTRAPLITISGYLKLFRESDANQARLLGKNSIEDLRRDYSIRHAVIATWQISFAQIQKTEPSAADLLALMSMFDRQGIPMSLLRNSTSQLDFIDALAPLLSFSLIREDIGKQSFEMHRLVQLSMRKWLEAEKQLSRWIKESIRVLASAFPSGAYGTWADCQELLPHAREAIGHKTGDEEDVVKQAASALKIGWYLYLRGEYKTAEEAFRMSVKGREKVLGLEHPDTLTSFNNLGLAFEGQGKYEEAEATHWRALEGYEKVLGPEHPNTLTSVDNLGWLLKNQGKYEEAEVMHRRAVEGFEKLLGPEHPDTLISIHNLGSVLQRQGKYREAEVMYRRDLEGCEKVLGPEHPDTLTSVNNLGSLLVRQGKYEEAEAMNQRVLEGYTKVLGPEHPYTLVSVYNAAFLFHRQKRYSTASELFQRAFNGYNKSLGAQHPTTIACLANYQSLVKEMESK